MDWAAVLLNSTPHKVCSRVHLARAGGRLARHRAVLTGRASWKGVTAQCW